MASRYRRIRARALKAVFRAHTLIYEASDGRLGTQTGVSGGMSVPTLLLSVVGRKSGKTHTTPLAYFEDGGSYVVVGSDGAARRDPQWWKNLEVNPEGEVRLGRRRFPVEAAKVEGRERDRLWELGKEVNPMWERYQRRTERQLPVVVLKPC